MAKRGGGIGSQSRPTNSNTAAVPTTGAKTQSTSKGDPGVHPTQHSHKKDY